MCFFKKKQSTAVQEDRELVAKNEKSIEALIVLAGDNEDFKKQLRLLQEKLKYLTPSETVKDYDKKIRNEIEDLRIILNKSEGELPKKAENTLKQILVLIGDRNANM